MAKQKKKAINDICTVINNKEVILQFDFIKAFDAISSSKLLFKLQGLRICSYLCGCYQCVFSHSLPSYITKQILVTQSLVLYILLCLYVNNLVKYFAVKYVSVP